MGKSILRQAFILNIFLTICIFFPIPFLNLLFQLAGFLLYYLFLDPFTGIFQTIKWGQFWLKIQNKTKKWEPPTSNEIYWFY